MNKIKRRLKDIKPKNIDFQITTVIKGNNEDINSLKVINGNIYVILYGGKIKVYNLKFKEIAKLELPFKPSLLEITEENTIVAFEDNKLFFFKFDLKENKLDFLHFLSEVYHFCYLKKKKEIMFLSENEIKEEPVSLGKTNLLGNILYYTKIKPKIIKEYQKPKSISIEDEIFMMSERFPIHFSNFDVFNNDKFIISIYGYTFNWYGKDEKYTLSIYDSDKLNLLFKKDYNTDFRYKKISDNLFKKLYDNEKIFYYNEKKNKIKYINNIYEGEYFYLKDDMFGVAAKNNILYIFDLSSYYITKELKIQNIYNENYDVNELDNLCYFYSNGKSYLFYTFRGFDKKSINFESEYRIVFGNIL